MPFWLKADVCDSDHRGDCMALVVHGEPLLAVEEPTGFPWLLVGTLVITFAAGLCAGHCIRSRTADSKEREADKILAAWERVTKKAIYFTSKRRRIGLAFGNYNGYTLRNTQGSRPTQARVARRRAASRGASLLHEGPALRDGPDGSRTSGR